MVKFQSNGRSDRDNQVLSAAASAADTFLKIRGWGRFFRGGSGHSTTIATLNQAAVDLKCKPLADLAKEVSKIVR